MKPRTKRIAHPQSARLPDQHQERGLKRIVDVVGIVEYGPADAQDHRSVPLDQGRKRQLGGFAPLGCKELQELTVGQLSDRTHLK